MMAIFYWCHFDFLMNLCSQSLGLGYFSVLDCQCKQNRKEKRSRRRLEILKEKKSRQNVWKLYAHQSQAVPQRTHRQSCYGQAQVGSRVQGISCLC